jgi:hypothetical protein
VEAGKPENLPSGAEQAAEKGLDLSEIPKKHPAGAKAQRLLSGTCGTTKVVPCYKTGLLLSFSAACEAHPIFSASCGTTKVVPCYKTGLLLSFSAACEAHPIFSASCGTTKVVPFQNMAFAKYC